jgi:gliding motility-associated-like protein
MNGGSWTFNQAPLASTIFDPATSQAGTYTYTVRSVSCNVTSTPKNVTIEIRNVLPIANSITATTTSVCSGTGTSVTFNGTPDAVITYQVNGGANQTVTLDSTGNGVVQTGNLSANATYTAVSASYPGPLACTQVIGANVNTTVNINPLPTATISGTATICSGTGTNISVTGTANATVTYNINGGSSQTVVLDGSGSASIATGNLVSNVTYNLVSVSESVNNCSQSISGQSATVTITNLTTPVIAQIANVCYNSPAVVNVSGGATNATLTYNIDGGAAQNIVLDANGAGQITTGNLIANAMINLTNMSTGGVNPCATVLTVSSNITVNPIIDITNLTTQTGNLSTCSGSNVAINVEGNPSSTVFYTISTAPTTELSIQIPSTGVAVITVNNVHANPTVVNITRITNTSGNTNCERVLNVGEESISITVVETPVVPNATVNVTDNTLCFGSPVTANISNAATLLDGTYNIQYSLSGANTVANQTATLTFNGGNSSEFVIPASLLTNSGEVTLTVNHIEFTQQCLISSIASNPVRFTVYPQIEQPSVKPIGAIYCRDVKTNRVPKVSNLVERLNVPQGVTIKWYDNEIGGKELLLTDELVNGASYFAEVQSTTSLCVLPTRIEVTVDTDKCVTIPEGFSPNEDGTNDEFIIPNIEIWHPNYSLEVYNRYGNKVFTGNANTKPWDGRAGHGRIGSDDVLPTGVYFYILNYNSDGEKPKQGTIYLSR